MCQSLVQNGACRCAVAICTFISFALLAVLTARGQVDATQA